MSDEKLAELTAQLEEANKGLIGLKAKNDELLGETKAAKAKAKEEAEAREKAVLDAQAKNGDVEAVKKSYEQKMAERDNEWNAKLGERDNLILGSAKADAIRDLSSIAIAGKDKGLRAYLQTRIKAEIKEGAVVMSVLDESGKLSALSVADLKKEIENDASWADVIEASKATGGGANGGKGGGAAKKSVTRTQFDSMNHVQRAEHMKAGGTVTN